mgnify:CR=1 FL=1|jgi:hypothetical protein
MNNNNIDQALSALGDALKGQEPEVNPLQLISQFPDRSLSGNLVNGGKILNFESAGIKDTATSTKITINNDRVIIDTLATNTISNSLGILGDLNVDGVIRVGTLEVEHLVTNLDQDYHRNKPVKYTGDLNGKGILWAGQDYTKQFVYQTDKIFSSESINIARGKNISINDVTVIDGESIGSSVVRSNLRQVGALQGLVVNGSVSVNNYMIYDANTDRLGLGTDQPNAALSVAEDGVEIIVGTADSTRGVIGTFGSHALDIVTDNSSRINVGTNGDVLIGNRQSSPIQASIHGKLSVKVNMPDPEVDLHVNGAVKFNNKLQTHGTTYPNVGEFNKGDIVWNSEPQLGSYAGWICVRAGNPGTWEPFGKIGNQ